VPCLAKACSGLEILRVLRNGLEGVDIPVVESYETNLLHGTVSRDEVEDILRMFYYEHNLQDIETDICKNAAVVQSQENGAAKTNEYERKKNLLKQVRWALDMEMV